MTAHDQAVAEERASRRQHRALEKARRVGDSETARRRAAVIRDVLRTSGRSCRCGITPQTTMPELRALNGGCTEPHYVCPTLDSVRRRLDQ